MVSVPREMSALDLLSYYHDNNIALVNVSQSLRCMPLVASKLDPLPCLTLGAEPFFICFLRKWKSKYASTQRSFPDLEVSKLRSYLLRPHGKFLVLSEKTEESGFLIGRELMILMGLPLHRMIGIDDASERVF